jgi:hypothetical protein
MLKHVYTKVIQCVFMYTLTQYETSLHNFLVLQQITRQLKRPAGLLLSVTLYSIIESLFQVTSCNVRQIFIFNSLNQTKTSPQVRYIHILY